MTNRWRYQSAVEADADLAVLLTCIHDDIPVPPPISDRIRDCLERFFDGEADSLDEVFGRCTSENRKKLEERNDLLRLAHTRFYGGRVRSAAREIERDLKKYQSSPSWKKDRREKHCPTQYAGTRQAILWEIMQVVDRIPSDETIRKLLGRSKG